MQVYLYLAFKYFDFLHCAWVSQYQNAETLTNAKAILINECPQLNDVMVYSNGDTEMAAIVSPLIGYYRTSSKNHFERNVKPF